MPRILYPFLPYRSFIVPILVVCAVAVPCWLIYRLYRRRTPGHRASFAREILLLILVVYLSALAAVTLEPNHPSRAVAEATRAIDVQPSVASLTCSAASLPTGSRAQGFCVRNARGNLLLFIPLGILLPLVWRRIRFWRGIQIATALSFSIELVQSISRAWGSYRTFDVNDIVLNVVGACLGLLLVSLVRLGRPRPAALSLG